MEKVASLSDKDREDIFRAADAELNMGLAIVEKDFWVCWVLKRLFESPDLNRKVLFKGGTSLSKCFSLIDRFSEDVDLILDWTLITEEDPYETRSNNKQDKFNKEMKARTAEYIAAEFLPLVESAMESHCKLSISSKQPQSIMVSYPKAFNSGYIKSEIELEIGAMSAMEPHADFNITPYCANALPDQFENKEVKVRSIQAVKTFWDKVTILHAEAHRPEDKKQPQRYSRHYYDMYKMLRTDLKEEALSNLDLLQKTIEFKAKFYPQGWANYPAAIGGEYLLSPETHARRYLEDDYKSMEEMIFGELPEFDEILKEIDEFNENLNSQFKALKDS